MVVLTYNGNTHGNSNGDTDGNNNANNNSNNNCNTNDDDTCNNNYNDIDTRRRSWVDFKCALTQGLASSKNVHRQAPHTVSCNGVNLAFRYVTGPCTETWCMSGGGSPTAPILLAMCREQAKPRPTPSDTPQTNAKHTNIKTKGMMSMPAIRSPAWAIAMHWSLASVVDGTRVRTKIARVLAIGVDCGPPRLMWATWFINDNDTCDKI